jgi:hypothetical protein
MMMHRAVNIIKESSAEEDATEEETTQEETTQDIADTSPHPTIERASAAFLAAAERLLSKLPDGKRAKLESGLLAAETDKAKARRQLLVASAEANTTKVRAAEKRTFLEAATTTEDAK